MSNRKAKIFIIGAGISGVTAAAQLISHGFTNVTILEAENRIGGRIHSIKYGKGFIDLGAQYCCGETGNTVYELCKDEFDFGVTGYDDHDSFVPFISDGSLIDRKKLARLHKLRNEIEAMIDEMNKSMEPAGVFFEENFFNALRTTEYSDIDDELRDMFLKFWRTQTTTIFACDTWYDLSAQGFASDVLCQGRQDMNWGTSGTKTIFDVVLKKLSGSKDYPIDLKDKILLNKKVTNINWTTGDCIIETSDLSVYHADHVIITIPLGVLQAHQKTLFNPNLPTIKKYTIENMRMGTLNKVFLEFEEDFWTKGFKLCSLMWTKKDMKELIETDKEWLLDIYGFLHVDGHPKLLECLFSGRHIKSYESYGDIQVENDCMWLLEKFLKRKIPRPISIIRTKWSSLENFLGSYSYIPMQATLNNVSSKDLAEPICDKNGKPILLFAGEATSLNHKGFVHGALDTGKRAAQEIIEFYSNVPASSMKNKL